MDIGTVVIATISVTLLVMLIGLFIWLTEGFMEPGIGMVAFGIGAVFLFFVFGWVLIIAIAFICSIIAGFLFMGGE